MGSLEEYRRKRGPGKTPEPMDGGATAGGSGAVFVVQRHDATRLHYDLRLEIDGALASWALPKGLPLEAGERFLAVHTEDHPMMYATFQGVIPKGQYGAGTMEIWDTGTYEMVEVKRDGGLTFRLHGERFSRLWTLVPAHLGGDEKNWLILKKHDDEHPPAAPAERARYLPMLATAATRLPRQGDWLFEVKWDGYRAVSRLAGNEASMWSRTGRDLNDRFAEIRRALPHALRTSDCVVDGEVCALDGEGRPSFGLLQSGGGSLAYYLFDLLEVEREPLIDMQLEARRARLEELIVGEVAPVRLSTTFDDGEALLERAVALRLEGVVAKRRGCRYRPGRRVSDWVKVKTRLDDEFLIAGYTRGTGAREPLGALVLAEERDGELEWAGNVGSGLHGASIDRLLQALELLRLKRSAIEPVSTMPKTPARLVTWVEPRLRARVEFTERTRDGRLRAPVFKGIVAEEEAPVETPVEQPPGRVAVRNPDKVFFPDDGVTKGDLFDYYHRIAPAVVPHLRGRPFTMLRYPDGIEGKSFFQKDAPDHMPEWIRTFTHEGIRYALVDDEASLLWMVNMGCVDMHPWLARRDRPERPDLVMFDLDPADGVPYSTVVDVALLVRQALGSLGLDGVPKTSGGKGLHILVPVERRHTHDQARSFVSVVAKALRNTYPDLVTTAWRRTDRHGVLIDANQNGLGRTTVSAYSVRPRPGALVSAPLRWEEVEEGLDPGSFTMAEVLRRVDQHGDLADALLSSRQRLPV